MLRDEFAERGWVYMPSLLNQSNIYAYMFELLARKSASIKKTPPKCYTRPHLENPKIIEFLFNDNLIEAIDCLMEEGQWSIFNLNHFTHSTGLDAHRDTLFYYSIPNTMLGVWIALEDISYKQGPFFAIDQSHRIPFKSINELKSINYHYDKDFELLLYHSHKIDLKKKFDLYNSLLLKMYRDIHHKAKYFFPLKKGDVILYNGSLYHGAIKTKTDGLLTSSRQSVVLHITHCETNMFAPNIFLKECIDNMRFDLKKRIRRDFLVYNSVFYDLSFC